MKWPTGSGRPGAVDRERSTGKWPTGKWPTGKWPTGKWPTATG
jgi:hypothetical protein